MPSWRFLASPSYLVMNKPLTIYTIGHSTHSTAEFIDILNHYKIKTVVDVRTIPKSRHNPQFDQASLSESLEKQQITYVHMKGLGGLRHPKKDSLNTAWRNLAFRGYADYMQTAEFTKNLTDLMQLAAKQPTAIMCAEAVPWRCHRSLIADALVVLEANVIEIISIKSQRKHTLTTWAKVEQGHVVYPETTQT